MWSYNNVCASGEASIDTRLLLNTLSVTLTLLPSLCKCILYKYTLCKDIFAKYFKRKLCIQIEYWHIFNWTRLPQFSLFSTHYICALKFPLFSYRVFALCFVWYPNLPFSEILVWIARAWKYIFVISQRTNDKCKFQEYDFSAHNTESCVPQICFLRACVSLWNVVSWSRQRQAAWDNIHCSNSVQEILGWQDIQQIFKIFKTSIAAWDNIHCRQQSLRLQNYLTYSDIQNIFMHNQDKKGTEEWYNMMSLAKIPSHVKLRQELFTLGCPEKTIFFNFAYCS